MAHGGDETTPKKQRVDELAAAIQRVQDIKRLDCTRFSNEGLCTELPYPALDHVFAGRRPGKKVFFVGRRNLYPAAVERVLNPVEEFRGRVLDECKGVLITGPSGSGKSCLVRAITCQLIKELPAYAKVVCFWYFDALIAPKRQVQDALLFAYCFECKADPELAREIREINDANAFDNFLRSRVQVGEQFYVVTDGEERIDPVKSDGTHHGRAAMSREEARKWLDIAFYYATVVVKALSPKSEEASFRTSTALYRWEVTELFQEVELKTFLTGTVLGEMLAKRAKRASEVEFFAGKHPLSLCMLDVACARYAKAHIQENDPVWIPLFDKESWSSVLATFRSGYPFKEIRDSIADSKTGDRVKRSFAIGDTFCSDYLQTVYMEAVANNTDRKYRCPELTGYVKTLLRRGLDFHNWSALGWACETFMGDAILKVGLKISGLGHIIPKTVVILYGGQPTPLNTTKLMPGESAYWSPAKYSFKYIDGILYIVDDKGEAHILAVQHTASPEGHRGTEVKFMERQHLRKWWPADQSRIHLHYVYICPRIPDNLERKIVVKRGQEVGGPGRRSESNYTVHVETMADCVPKLGNEEYELLSKLAGARDAAMKKRAEEKKAQFEAYRSELSRQADQVRKMHDNNTRGALEYIALSKGTSRSVFPNKLELVKAICSITKQTRTGKGHCSVNAVSSVK